VRSFRASAWAAETGLTGTCLHAIQQRSAAPLLRRQQLAFGPLMQGGA
jgi:hypothetical protein